MAKINRYMPLIIAAVFIAPMLTAWIAHTAWHPKLMNYGELVESDAPTFNELHDAAGHPVGLDSMHGKWLLVTVTEGICDAGCQHNVYLARQVRLAQGRDQSRISRVLISSGPSVETKDSELRSLYSSAANLHRMTAGVSSRTYIVDPHGLAVLRFPEQPKGKEMIRDLHRLLQASHIG